MNNEAFVEAIKQYVGEAAVEDMIANLKNPPGRRVSQKEKMRSDWYNSLSELERDYIGSIVADAVHEALFGLLAVLDGVRAIEDGESKGHFELSYVDEKNQILLNNPNDIGLHDLFNVSE
ncbi:hypothetical protein [Methylocaldum sp. 14B]|jgi:hypothetical protein|uniref:hypothetical protein n=1 Tax=unclassified Methylocaldum TaxID=2622260 RepID=UPI000989D785|nr:hypothetical protein [Methylocaldum sp. 14B]